MFSSIVLACSTFISSSIFSISSFDSCYFCASCIASTTFSIPTFPWGLYIWIICFKESWSLDLFKIYNLSMSIVNWCTFLISSTYSSDSILRDLNSKIWKLYSDPKFKNLASKCIGLPFSNLLKVSIGYYDEVTPKIRSGISSCDSVGFILIYTQ